MDQKNCVFCKIVNGEIPCFKVYEGDLFLGFLDASPATKGHSLIVPKKHVRWVHDVEPFGKYWEAALKVARVLEAGLKPGWSQYLTHGGAVPHAHIHVIPRYDKIEGSTARPGIDKRVFASKEELEEVYERLRPHLDL